MCSDCVFKTTYEYIYKDMKTTSVISFDTGEVVETEDSPVAAKTGYDLKTPKILKEKN